MKKILIFCAMLISSLTLAQQNTLLQQDFWKNSPTVELVKKEVANGNSPSQFNPASFDPVVMAINAKAPVETIKFLLDQPGNDVGKLTHDARTYFHWAAAAGNVEIMEYLVSKGAKANIVDSHGATALNFAAGGGQQNLKVYDMCLANGADLKKDLNQEGANALLLAISADTKELTLTNYFISNGLDLKSKDKAGNNAFSYAARAGNIDMLKILLQKGVPAQDNAMLMAAQGTRKGPNPIEVYQYLESLKLKPTARGENGENALHILVRKPKQNEIIKYFLSKGVDVNQVDEEGNTVFINAAASSRDTTLFELLMPKTKNVNQGNLKGVTAIAMAVRSNSPEIVRYLIVKGVSINAADSDGNNLAYYLIRSYNPRGANDFEGKLKILQQKGFNIATPQKNGNTLYHLAVAKNDLSLIKRVEGLQIDINGKNAEGLTALHKAAMISKDDAIMKYLLSIGAKKEIETNFKETAFDLAGENESLSKNNVTVNFLK